MSLTRNLQRLFLALCVLACGSYVSIEASVVGIDYGTDWFKVSLIKPVRLFCHVYVSSMSLKGRNLTGPFH